MNLDGADTVQSITAAGGRAAAVGCDVSDPEQVEAMIDSALAQFGRIDVLVNDAGISGGSEPAHETPVDVWTRTIAVNLTGTFLCVRAAMPHLLASGNGAVINIASTYGLIGAPHAVAYCASKGGIVNLTRQLAVDYSSQGVRVNAICPGYINTDMGGHRASLGPEGAVAANARRDAAAALQPIGRQADAEEVARVAVFLAGDGASFMTGAVVPVDGGCTTTFRHP